MGKHGVGMPAAIYLDHFGQIVRDTFDAMPYQVGSSLDTTEWRDVDVRVILSDAEYEAWGFGDPEHTHCNARWVSLTLAFSALGRHMTGLPIDFQIQQQTRANAMYKGVRNALSIHAELSRRAEYNPPLFAVALPSNTGEDSNG